MTEEMCAKFTPMPLFGEHQPIAEHVADLNAVIEERDREIAYLRDKLNRKCLEVSDLKIRMAMREARPHDGHAT